MTVAELIEFLKTQPQTLQVGYQCYSEFCLMEKEQITIESAGKPREDGWIADAYRTPQEDQQQYLMFPGN